MDYTPRFSQPFSLNEAIGLDIAVISEEISRLQNSLKHLKETQDILQSIIQKEPDAEITKAFEDNKLVIGSQEERINILQMALSEKGVQVASPHYDIHPTVSTAQPPNLTGRSQLADVDESALEDGGVYL